MKETQMKTSLWKRTGIKLWAIGILWSLMSCGNHQTTSDQDINPDSLKKDLMDVNEFMVKNENQQIENYIARHQWKMEKTGTGLRYSIYEKGNGPKAEKGKVVQIRFTASLITGDVVYDAKTDGMRSVKLGKAQVVSGLEEGLLMMQEGDKAKLIIPSHLAFGLVGDDNKIPKRATLIYDIELVKVL